MSTSIETWLAEIEAACNGVLLDVYDLSITNASISPEFARQTADCIGNRAGQIRESMAIIRTKLNRQPTPRVR